MVHTKEKQVMIKSIYDSQAWIVAVYSSNDDRVGLVGLYRDVKDSGIKANREVVTWSEEGEPSMANKDSVTMGAMDTISLVEGVLSIEQATGYVLVENSVSAIVKEHEATSPTTMIVNTYNWRYSKCLKGRDLENEKALVV